MILIGGCFTLAAQPDPMVGVSESKGYQTNFKKNRARDNWFISAGAGMGVLFGDQNGEADFKNRLNTNPHFAFGKWINPYLGMRTYFTGGVLHGFEGKNATFMQHNRFMAGHVDFMYDVTNHWGVYDERRIFRFIPWIGLGYAQRFPNQGRARSETPTLNAGILTAFRLSERLDFNIEVQGALLNEHFNRVQRRASLDGLAQLSAGLTVKLGKTKFEVIEPMDYELVNNLNDKINRLRSENEQLGKRPVSCPECPKCPDTPVVTNQPVTPIGEALVCFRFNSAQVDKSQLIHIHRIVQLAKEKGYTLRVTGYADQTGDKEYNRVLSEKRAKAVVHILTETYQFPYNKIITDWHGSDTQPFGTNSWNRIVIISTAK